MAIATFKYKMFSTAHELYEYVTDAAGDVTTVVSIVFDTASGKFVLFYE